ncbi:MAG: hypothetical protein KBS63_06130 [Clostridiales bacterium]|nr:hypothetical protein [Candidatus Crickella caballi]
MNRDKLMTILAFACGIFGAFSIVSAKFIIGGLFMVGGLGIFWARGSGKFNERSLYEKIVKANGTTIEQIYEELKDMDTPFGKPWLAGHHGFEGDSIVFGPNIYKDMIVISYDAKHKEINLKHMNKVGNINRTADEEWRFENLINASEIEVTPENYSDFAAYKEVCVVMLMQMTELVERIVNGEADVAPEELDKYDLFFFNSGRGEISDLDGSKYMTVDQDYNPFTAKVFDMDGDELASIVPRAYDKKGRVVDKAGYDMYVDGEVYATIERNTQLKHDTFFIKTEDEEFVVQNFAGVDRANIHYNYTIKRNDELLAIVGGNPNLVFDGLGACEHDLILSCDNDYLTLYAAFWVFLMTLNRALRQR